MYRSDDLANAQASVQRAQQLFAVAKRAVWLLVALTIGLVVATMLVAVRRWRQARARVPDVRAASPLPGRRTPRLPVMARPAPATRLAACGQAGGQVRRVEQAADQRAPDDHTVRERAHLGRLRAGASADVALWRRAYLGLRRRVGRLLRG